MNTPLDEEALINSLRPGDEAAFTQLVEQYHASLVRLATLYVRDTAIAEELAQETWLAVLQGLQRFEKRSSLKTWLFTILTNKAKTRGQRENRTISYTELEETLQTQPTVDPARFNDASAGAWTGHWAPDAKPDSWESVPENLLLSQEITTRIRQTIDQLPDLQRAVITLHDLEELPAPEICNILTISETNQRVLLHRARAKVRQALEDYLQLEP